MLGQPNIKIRIRRKLISLMALLFVIYVLADVSVLQAYCGNEAIGIPPDHHLSDARHHPDRSNDSPCSAEQADCQRVPDDHEYDHHHQCFGWQQVVAAFYSFEPGTADQLSKAQPPIFYEDLHSNSALSHLFRPPRTA